MVMNKIVRRLLIVSVLVAFCAFFSSSNALGQSGGELPKDLYTKANEFFDNQNWQDAYKIYLTLISKYENNSFVKPKIKEIEDKISQCEQHLGIIKDISKLLHGNPKLEKRANGDKVLKLSYTFDNEEDIDDFDSSGFSDTIKIVNGALQIKASYGTSAKLKDIIFMNEITLEYDVMIVPPTDQEAFVRVFYDFESSNGYIFSLRYKESSFDPPSMVFNCVRLQCGNDYRKSRNLVQAGRPKIEPGKTYTVKIAVKNNQLSFYINNELVKTVTDKTYTQGRIAFGADSSTVQYDNIKIEGVVNPSWLDKAFSTITTEKLAEKERELPPSLNTDEVKMDLSAEADSVLTKIPSDIITKYKQAKAAMLKFPFRISSFREYLKPIREARKSFDEIIKYVPDFAAAYYQRALCAGRLDENDTAIPDLSEAIKKFPEFYEAYCKRGDLYLDMSEYTLALADYEKCISLKQDYSKGYSGRGYILFVFNERDKALADLEKAIDLDSSNHEAVECKENFEHVLKGPLWPISYDKETAHFMIKTDINQDKCDLYGGQLETMYKYYCEVLDIKENKNAPPRKKKVYVFNTEEGYQTYAEFSTQDRAEYTLGYYHPHYQELLVFERPTKEAQVIKVLYHEGFHMTIDAVLPKIPIWLNEGFAEYFFGTELTLQGKAWQIAKKGQMTERIDSLQYGMQSGGAVSFETIMNESREEYYSEAYIRYGQGWSLVHFFLHYKQGVYKNVLMDYIKALKKGRSQFQVYEDVFKKQDVAKMQKEWVNYIQSLKPPK